MGTIWHIFRALILMHWKRLVNEQNHRQQESGDRVGLVQNA